MFENFVSKLSAELKKDLPGKVAQNKMAPVFKTKPEFLFNINTAKKSAVLIIIFPQNSDFKIIFIKRKNDGSTHSGQVAFPGGKFEKEDISLINTSIRETFEEIGVRISNENIIGSLTPIYIPVSNFEVAPFVGFLHKEPEYKLSTNEVEKIITVKISDLLDVNKKGEKLLERGNYLVNAPFFKTEDDIIWGATAMMLSELNEVILRFN